MLQLNLGLRAPGDGQVGFLVASGEDIRAAVKAAVCSN